MMIQPGRTLSHYRLAEKIGEGGMGEVWRGIDVTLDRPVAIKILPEIFSGDPERRTRFEREAKLLASLNHPGIAVIHGLHQSEGIHFLAMELVEGEDLSRRIQRGALPVEEALDIGRQVAEALEAAHESGVIHRDLKPANIQINPDGKAKILDFGLAKAFETEPRSGSPSLSPTLTSAGTRAGVLLGTASYMSPEQARGRAVDRRTDIWAFGCVLYEMLTGQKVFPGETISDTLAAVLKSEPDWSALPAGTPPALRRLLRRCLVKDPKERLRDIGEARIALGEGLALPAGEPDASAVSLSAAAPGKSGAAWRMLPWLLLALTAIAGPFLTRAFRPAMAPPAREPMSLTVDLSSPNPLQDIAGATVVLSPDGRRVAYVAGAADARRLFIRRLDQLKGTPLAGTEGAYAAFFSPDGRWIAFFSGNKLKKVDVSGGAPMTLADVESGDQARGGAWGVGGNIVFTPQFEDGLYRISDSGGTPVPLTRLDSARKERSHRWPHFLPGGRTVLFSVQITGQRYDDGEIDAVTLASGERKKLYTGGAYPRFASTGHLLFARNGSLFAVPFDAERLEVTGPPRSIVDRLASSTGDQEAGDGSAQYDLAASGTLAYRSALGQSLSSMVWVDREGKITSLGLENRAHSAPAISPDGRRIAVAVEGASGSDLWIDEIDRGVLTRLTFNGAANTLPTWTPDSRRVTYVTLGKEGVPNIFWKRADGAGEAERLLESPHAQYPGSWSPDGKALVLYERNPDTIWDLSVFRPGDRESLKPYLGTPATEGFPAFSPDGRWIAYMSDESGQYEIYVRPYPGPGGKWQISTQGGAYPRWSRTGGELFYRSREGVCAVSYQAAGDSFQAGRPRELFRGNFATVPGIPDYDVSPDGRRFVMFVPEGEEARMARTHVILVFNWLEELRRVFR